MTLRPPLRLVVPPSLGGRRLDQFVAAATGLSRRAARRLAGEGGVWKNGRPVRVLSRTVETGDVIDLIVREEIVPAIPAPPAVEVLHDDGWLLAAIKPSGTLSQPSEERDPNDLALDQLLMLQLARREGRRPYLRLLHRLDRLTSGVLLFARRPQALGPAAAAWRDGAVCRLYLGVVLGDPGPGERVVEAPLARDPAHRWRFAVRHGGKPAVTIVRPLGRGPRDTTLVSCTLRTGRTHQVRVHLAHLGHPVAGDRLYGGALPGISRPLLHAVAIRMPHPRNGAPFFVEAPLPTDFVPLLPEGWDPSALPSPDEACRPSDPRPEPPSRELPMAHRSDTGNKRTKP